MGNDQILKYFLEQGTTAGFMLLIIWVLIKKILQQQDVRIEALERASQECQADRKELHGQIVSMQQNHIDALSRRREQE
ncbi:MAG: hypothetical protein QM496_01845 [Verrucomicrobiota bacterium]